MALWRRGLWRALGAILAPRRLPEKFQSSLGSIRGSLESILGHHGGIWDLLGAILKHLGVDLDDSIVPMRFDY